MDDLHKPGLDNLGWQDLTTDEMAAWDTVTTPQTGPGIPDIETFGAVGKQPAWVQYMTNWDECYGNFTDLNKEGFMVFSRNYGHDNNFRLNDATTYIDPRKYLYAFAYTGIENMPYWVQIDIKAEARRIIAGVEMPKV